MEHFFELPVTYKNEEHLLKGRLVTFAYEYKYYIQVEGNELIFELDNEREFRVIGNDLKEVNTILIQTIVSSLEKLQQLKNG